MQKMHQIHVLQKKAAVSSTENAMCDDLRYYLEQEIVTKIVCADVESHR